MAYYACLMHAFGDIDKGQGFNSESQAAAFGLQRNVYGKLSDEDDPHHWENYDPPVVLLFELSDLSEKTLLSGKYTRPVAIYQTGEKWACIKHDSESDRNP